MTSSCERHATSASDGTSEQDRSGTAERLALAAAVLTVVLWASAFVAIRHVGAAISPGPLALARLCLGSIVLAPFVLASRRRRVVITRRDLPPLLVCGVVWYAGYNLLLNSAEVRIDAGTASLLVNVGPVVVTVLAVVVLRERVGRDLVLGTALGLLGTAVIAQAASRAGHGDVVGVALAAGAGSAYALGMVAQKTLAARIPALQITWFACLIGAVACAPYAPGLVEDIRAASAGSILWVLYLGLFPTAVAFSTWSYALSHTTAAQLGATVYLMPPIAIVLSLAFLHEAPTVLSLVGGAVCLLGVYMTRRQPRTTATR